MGIGWSLSIIQRSNPRRFSNSYLKARLIPFCSGSPFPLIRTILGKVKHRVDSVYAFEDVLKAYEKVISGRAVGKIVVEVPAAQPPTSTDSA